MPKAYEALKKKYGAEKAAKIFNAMKKDGKVSGTLHHGKKKKKK